MASGSLVPGDVLVVPPSGLMLSCDAALLTGHAIVNEAMLTGTSHDSHVLLCGFVWCVVRVGCFKIPASSCSHCSSQCSGLTLAVRRCACTCTCHTCICTCTCTLLMCVHVHVHDKQTSRHLPNIHKETQHNSTTPEEGFFLRKISCLRWDSNPRHSAL